MPPLTVVLLRNSVPVGWLQASFLPFPFSSLIFEMGGTKTCPTDLKFEYLGIHFLNWFYTSEPQRESSKEEALSKDSILKSDQELKEPSPLGCQSGCTSALILEGEGWTRGCGTVFDLYFPCISQRSGYFYIWLCDLISLKSFHPLLPLQVISPQTASNIPTDVIFTWEHIAF